MDFLRNVIQLMSTRQPSLIDTSILDAKLVKTCLLQIIKFVNYSSPSIQTSLLRIIIISITTCLRKLFTFFQTIFFFRLYESNFARIIKQIDFIIK